jgi:hypothetical protein
MPRITVRVLRRDRPGGLIHEYAQVAYGDTIFGTHKLGVAGRVCPASRRLGQRVTDLTG